MRILRRILLLAAAGGCSLCGAAPAPEFSSARLRENIRELASDAYEGRGPGTAGEDKTIAFLTAKFREYGLEPGNPDGTYLQAVPLVGITSHTRTHFHVGDQDLMPAWINDYIAFSHRTAPKVSVRHSGLIFCGYGVVAPEYHWNDFKDVDVRGKTIVVLVNDPPVPDPAHPGQLDPAMFKGKAMTYYGRWTYKYEEAAAKGAAGCLIVHETGPAGYPFAVIAVSSGRENFDLRSANGNTDQVAVAGWLTLPMAQRLIAAAGFDFARLKAAAARPDFRPVELHGTADFEVENTVRDVSSHNVVAKVTGSDPQRRDEYVIYSAHWDHLGRDSRLKGDQIFHGAKDNASGTAALLELARAFASLPPAQRPPRSLLFLAVTAEEKGLLGSRYYAQHPLYPLTHTLADLNMDVVNVYGRTRDLVSVGLGASTLDDVAAEIARQQSRRMVGEPNPERGTYYRSDHFEFAKVGVPACMMKGGTDLIGQPAGRGQELEDAYVTNFYHQVTDTIRPDWTLEGAVQDMETLYDLGQRVARAAAWPQWKPGNEFKARRDAMMSTAAP